MAKLKTEMNTAQMGERVLQAFLASCYAETEARADPLSFDSNFEHGQWWITCSETGAQWSVVDAEGGRSIDGFDFEQVSLGDQES